MPETLLTAGDGPTSEEQRQITHEFLVQQLLRPEAYPEEVSAVSLAQTHISSLFFTEHHVYKVKKAVNFGFLDFTTLSKRRYFCRQEVTLNRRLAPDVYLDVVEVRESGGRLAIGGAGRTVEYAVKMRRLPPDRSLAQLLHQQTVSPQEIRGIGEMIARFHSVARTSPAIARLGGITSVRRNVEENFRQTRRYVGWVVDRDTYDDLAAYSRAFMDTRTETFIRRASEGRIRDGHGDLLSADIFLVNGVQILDCIEFNRRFRYGDVTADIAFLAMDLDFHGRTDLSTELIEAYIGASADSGVLELLDFFKAYRAYVRAKVTSFRLDDTSLSQEERQQVTSTAQAYYKLAHSYTHVVPQPSLIMVVGLMGTGKSTVGEELSRRWGAVHISSDVTRKALFDLPAGEHRYEAYDQGIYSPDVSRRTYDAMLSEANGLLARGQTVVLDATYRSAAERQRVVEAGRRVSAGAWIVECVVPPETVRRRVRRRVREGTSASDATWELYEQQSAEWEPVAEVPPERHVRLDTSATLQKTMQSLLYQVYAGALNNT